MTDIQTFTHPDTGQTFKLGRNKPIAVGPHLKIGNYMLRTLPIPPTSASYIAPAQQFLQNILGNDSNGNCTVAAAFHIAGMLLQNAGQPLPIDYTAPEAVQLYYHLTGGQDTGLSEQTVFNWWQNYGLTNGIHKIQARVFVDPTDQEQCMTALWLFENLYLTAGLPDEWIHPFPFNGNFTWGVAGDPNPRNGHAWIGCAYETTGVWVDSWGLFGIETWSAIAKYNNQKNGGGCFSVISLDSINVGSQKAPNGFDWTQLQADIASFQV